MKWWNRFISKKLVQLKGESKMEKEDLRKVLDAHIKYLNNEEEGARANLVCANLEGANLRDANLERADLRGANLRDANLERADLCGANLERAYLVGADLRGAYLRYANLDGANLCGANLERADLEGTDLWGADIRDANLVCANLEGANLCGANLCGANLRYANLERADLEGAHLWGADLEGAKLLNIKNKFIFTFNIGWHFGYFCDGVIKIGCIVQSAFEWVTTYEIIGKEYNYSEDAIRLYGGIIKYINDNFCKK